MRETHVITSFLKLYFLVLCPKTVKTVISQSVMFGFHVKLKISYDDLENSVRFRPKFEGKIEIRPTMFSHLNLDTHFTLFRRIEAR